MNSRRAILFNDWHPSHLNGGEEQVLRQVMLGLAGRGWRCLLAYHEWGDFIPEYEAAGMECRQFDLSAARPKAPARLLKSALSQLTWARRERVGLLYCNSYARAPVTAIAKMIGSLPAVCHLHLEPPSYLSRQYRWGLGRIGRFIAVSDWSAAQWTAELGLPAKQFAALHNPIDTSRFRPDADARAAARQELGLDSDDFVIGYCGRLVRGKGVDVLVRAAAPLMRRDSAVKLLIIGSDAQNILHYDEPVVPVIKALAVELGIADQVTFLGVRPDVERWYNAMDTLVAPVTDVEPFCLVVAEALACGRPAIASRLGGIPEILQGSLSELMVPPSDVDALAGALQRMLEDTPRRDRLGTLGRRFVQANFALQPYLDRLEHLVEEIVA